MADQDDTKRTRPNVIWVFGDQHRGQALSCAGDPNVNTPNLDRMAREGPTGRRRPSSRASFPRCTATASTARGAPS